MAIPRPADGLKTFFVVKDREDFSVAKVVVASCTTKDFVACGKAAFARRAELREKYSYSKFTIDTIIAPRLDLPLTLDRSLIENIAIP